MRKWSLCVLVGLLVLGIGLVGFGQDKETIIIGTTDRVANVSPANSWDHYTWHLLRMCSDALLEIKPKTDEVGPAIAEDWEVGPNAKVYTFYIREGITFTDGTTCDAHDVKWSLERALRLDGPEGGVGLIKMIDTIEVVNDLTVKITLKRPNATFLKRMTGQIAPSLIWSSESTPEDDFAKGEFAGVGPYKLTKFTRGQSAVYEAYENYYGPKPANDQVIEVKYTNAPQLRSAIEAGDIDVAFRTLNPTDINALEKNPNLEAQHPPTSPSVRYMLFNVTHETFKDERVRRAITYAVDRQALVEQVYSGVAKPIYTMVPAALEGGMDTFPERDLEKAEQLLESAGYTEDDPLEATLWFTPKHYGTTEADVAAVIQGSLQDVPALDVEVRSLEWGAYIERQSSGGFGMFLLGWYPDYLEASNFLAPWTVDGPESLGTFFNHHPNYEAYKRILETALATPDMGQRADLYEAVQILSAQDVMWIPLWANLAQAYVIYKPEIKNCFVDLTMDIRPWLISKD